VSLMAIVACGSKAPSDTTTIGAAGSSGGNVGAAGSGDLSGEMLFPTSENVDGSPLPSDQTPPVPGSIATVPVASQASGTSCQTGTECSSLSCKSGACSAVACVSDGSACASADECCGGRCDGGTCTALNLACKSSGNACGANTECCSGLCTDGSCRLASSFCTQSGDVCGYDSECCTGACVIAAGATLGSCAAPPAGATNCGGGVDGSLCNGCGQCCSRLCAPFGDTGIDVCQPASGCHVNGDLCREDRDCCGAPGTDLPGAGNVTCDKEPGRDVGICRNPTGCSPQGNVCHYQDYACSISSSRNNCCGATGNSGACQLDPLGVPRCNGLSACRAGGEICASGTDCCDGRPCVPDATGQLRCSSSDVPDACIISGNSCSINADCCTGVLCEHLPGSTQGTCGASPPGSDTPPDTGDPTSPPPPTYACAVYGQRCTQGSDCCSGVPCTAGLCVYETVIR